MQGWIKLHRKITDRERYDDHSVCRLFFHLLLCVNYETKQRRGVTILPGQLVSSHRTLALETGLTVKQIRRCIKVLTDSGEILQERARKRQVISVKKWREYQDGENQKGRQKAGKGHTKGKQRATTKEREEKKNERNEYKRIRERANFFSKPSIDEIQSFMIDKELEKLKAKTESQKFFHHYESNGRMVGKNKMKNRKSACSGRLTRMRDYQKTSGKSQHSNELTSVSSYSSNDR